MSTSLVDLSIRTFPTFATLGRVALSNLPFLLMAIAPDKLPAMVSAICAGAILFVVPGLAWVPRRSGDGFVIIFRVVATSLIATVASWFPVMLLPGPTSRLGVLLGLWAVTNGGLVVGFRRQWYEASPLRSALVHKLFLVAVMFWAQSFIGALWLVPALEDQDMETQGTAYGLMHEFEPTMVTNRGTTYFFAHPLLLHYWIGASALISDDLDRLRYYHESAVQLRGAPRVSLDAQWATDFAQFELDPVLLPTRVPNLFLGVAVLFPIGFLVYRLSGSEAAAVVAAVLYATLPEVYVRTAYGGYMAVSVFMALSTAYFYLDAANLFPHRSDGTPPTLQATAMGLGAAFLAALTNQKALLVPSAAAAHACWRTLAGGWKSLADRGSTIRAGVAAALALGVGFLAGWGAFVGYGLLVSPDAFVSDHLREHIIDRMRLRGLYLSAEPKTAFAYPSVLNLWLQFTAHSGWLLVVPAALAVAAALRRLSSGRGFLAIWVMAGAMGFSVVDWRQTKHFHETIVPAIVVLTAVYWASAGQRVQMAMTAALSMGIVWNLYRVFRLMNDFSYITPTPLW